jgi:ABC-type nitrate/sulfonate/bicarbonate transport system substrate-binding protein
MRVRRCCLITLLALLYFFQLSQGQTVTLRYGQIPSSIKTISALQFHLAQRKGFFSREGINLEMLPIEGGAANMVVALNKGMVEITRTATPYLIQDVLKGSDNVAIAGETATPIYSLNRQTGDQVLR